MNFIPSSILVALCFFLISCGGSQSLEFSYPHSSQTEFSTNAPILLRFTSAITDLSPESKISLRDAWGNSVEYTVLKVADSRGLKLTLDKPLDPLSEYILKVGEIALENGLSKLETIAFSTRGLTSGPRNQVTDETVFTVRRLIPNGEGLPILDFSTLRLQFTQPIDPSSVKYGDNFSLVGPTGLVAAQLLISGAYLTLDPEVDLSPGVEYSLNLASSMKSIYGEPYTGTSITFSPQSSVNHSNVALELVDSAVSELTGDPSNVMLLDSLLLGDNSNIHFAGVLATELVDTPDFTSAMPLRIKKGALINGSSIDLLMGGKVPLGFSSGATDLRFISDATGFLLKNSYSNSITAPREMILFADIAVSTGDAKGNAALSQNLLHVEFVGTAFISNGRLTADIVGMTPMRILGAEEGNGLLSFNMSGTINEEDPPLPTVDTTSPSVYFDIENEASDYYQVNDSIITTYSEPLDTASIVPGDNLRLVDLTEGVFLPFSFHQQGSMLVIKPESPFVAGRYYASMLDNLKDMTGNFGIGTKKNFKVSGFVEGDPHSPVILSAYPGYPCVLKEPNIFLSNGEVGAVRNAGFCDVGVGSDGNADKGDTLPIPRLPANRPIRVTFSQDMAENSINSNTFSVEQVVNDALNFPVAGQLKVAGASVIFVPNQPWEVGSVYRYTLKSTPTVTANDCGAVSICDLRGLPIQTKMLDRDLAFVPAPTDGGVDLITYFDAVEPTVSIMQSLDAFPTADMNANFKHDMGEPIPSSSVEASMNVARLVRNPAGNLFYDNSVPPNDVFSENGIPKRRDLDGDPIDQNGEKIRTFKQDSSGNPIEGDLLLNAEGELIDGFPIIDRRSRFNGKLAALVVGGYPVVDASSASGELFTDVNVGCGFDEGEVPLDCPDKTYLHLNSSLNTDIVGYLTANEIRDRYGDDSSIPDEVKIQGAVLAYIYPGQIFSSSVTVYSAVKLKFTAACVPPEEGGAPVCFKVPPVDTGPLVMRIRYECDVDIENDCMAPDYGRVKGWIVEDKSTGMSKFITRLNLLLDAPAFDPIVEQIPFGFEEFKKSLVTTHNLYSRELSLDLSGKLDVLTDGRMYVQLTSNNPLVIDIKLNIENLFETEHVYLTMPAGDINLNLISTPFKQ